MSDSSVISEASVTSEASANGTHAPSATVRAVSAKPKRRPVLLIVALVAVVVVGYGGYRWWVEQSRYAATNDAQVKGDILAVSPKIGGRIAHVYHQIGDHVNKGELIAELDPTDAQIQVQQAEANLESAKVAFGTSQMGVVFQTKQTGAQQEQAAAGVQAARRNAHAAEVARRKAAEEFQRLDALYREGGVSQQQEDNARAALDTANDQVAALTAQLKNAQAGITLADAQQTQVQMRVQNVQSSHAQVAQAEAALAAARQTLANTHLYAPTSGTVGKQSLHDGEMVSPGQPILNVVSDENVRVEAFLEETKVQRVRLNAPVFVEVDAYGGRTFTGHVSDTGAAAGSEFALIPQNNSVGNFTKVVQRLPIRIEMDDPKHELKPGMSVNVRIDLRAAR